MYVPIYQCTYNEDAQEEHKLRMQIEDGHEGHIDEDKLIMRTHGKDVHFNQDAQIVTLNDKLIMRTHRKDVHPNQ